jgi:hypothetical protein
VDTPATGFEKYRRYALVLALLPACAAFCAQFFPNEARSSSAIRKPPLAFRQYSVNLGQVEPRRDHFAHFTFMNRGTEPIKIRKLETSCGCLTQHLKKRVFAPGEHGEFYLRVQSANQTPGPKQYQCKVLFGPPDKPDVEYATDLTYRITLPVRSVSVSPRGLIFHQQNPTRTTHNLDVIDLRDRRLSVLDVTCDARSVDVKLIDSSTLSEQDVARGVIERIKVTVDGVLPGTHEHVVRIRTDDEEFNVLKVPLRIHGPNQFSVPRSEASRSKSPGVLNPVAPKLGVTNPVAAPNSK